MEARLRLSPPVMAASILPGHIFVMNADGTERRNLTGDTHLRDNWGPTWSPDGRKIAFSSRRFFLEGTRNDIFAITADGKEIEQLTDGARNNRSPVYSPDGTKIAYVSRRGGDANIYLMDTNGRNAVKLTKTPPGIDNVNAFLAASWCIGGQPKRKVADILGSSQTARRLVMMSTGLEDRD